MSEDNDNIMSKTGNQLLDEQLAKSLFMSWQKVGVQFNISVKGLINSGSSIVQNYGSPEMPKLDTKQLIEYIKMMRQRLEEHRIVFDEAKNLVNLTVKFINSKK